MGLLSFLKRRPAPPPVRLTPPGLRLYAVGDIHGRFDLLVVLLEAIIADSDTADEVKLIFLGDYVDRGPQSREVIEALLRLQESGAIDCCFLRGNHDETLLKFTEDASVGRTWCSYGGIETMESYGVTPPRSKGDLAGWEEARLQFCERLGPRHFKFFENLEPSTAFGDYFFVHAGVRPGVPLDEQELHDLLWIREDFLRATTHLEKAIVHGHTPEPEAFVNARRIGIDTGAYASGVLTAAVLEGAERRLIQAKIQHGQSSVHQIDISAPVEVDGMGV